MMSMGHLSIYSREFAFDLYILTIEIMCVEIYILLFPCRYLNYSNTLHVTRCALVIAF